MGGFNEEKNLQWKKEVSMRKGGFNEETRFNQWKKRLEKLKWWKKGFNKLKKAHNEVSVRHHLVKRGFSEEKDEFMMKKGFNEKNLTR